MSVHPDVIRRAETRDLGALIAMARRFDAASQYGTWDGFDGGAVGEMLEAMLTDDASALFVAEAGAGEIVGAIGVSLLPSLKSRALIRMERFWWVEPEARGLGLALYRAADRWARAHGAEIHSLVSPAADEAVARLYRRMGYVPVETVWVKT